MKRSIHFIVPWVRFTGSHPEKGMAKVYSLKLIRPDDLIMADALMKIILHHVF
ncbi:MAG: hypothetical protein ACXWWC_16280 [Chitinophagaceae bacterium]